MLSIEWAGAPLYCWPITYNVTWVPLYNRFIVTASADGPDAYGACDFALGSFDGTGSVTSAAAEIIQEDWEIQMLEHEVPRWDCLFGTGLITEAQAVGMADRVWAARSEEDLEDLE